MRAGSPIKNKLWDFFLIGTWAFMQEQDQLRKETNRFYSAFIRSLVTQKRYISIQATHLQTHTHQTTDTHIQINTTHVHIYINMIFHVQKTPCIHTHTNIYTPPIAHNRRVHTHAHAVPNAYICICVCMCVRTFIYIYECARLYMFSEEPRTWKPWLETSRLYAWPILISELNVVADVTHVHRIIVIISLYLLKDSCGRRGAVHWMDTCLACKSFPRHTVGA